MLEVKLSVRILHDSKQLSLKKYALLCEQMVMVEKNLGNWMKYNNNLFNNNKNKKNEEYTPHLSSWRQERYFLDAAIGLGGFVHQLFRGKLLVELAVRDDALRRATFAFHQHQRPTLVIVGKLLARQSRTLHVNGHQFSLLHVSHLKCNPGRFVLHRLLGSE